MNSKIYIKSTEMDNARLLFRTSKLRDFSVRLSVDEIFNLQQMLMICIKHTEELEFFILLEIRQRLAEKYDTIQKRGFVNKHKQGATFRWTTSETYTMFVWMNEYSFEHPLHSNLSYNIVNQIYKQLL
jgi:hypothetical protein